MNIQFKFLLVSFAVVFAAPVFAIDATYTVPASSKFKSVQTNKISGVEWTRTREKLFVTYPLPSEIVGPDYEHIKLSGSLVKDSRFVKMEGEHACGFCMIAPGGGAPTCLVDYPGLKVEEKKVDTFLEANYVGADLDLRKQLARLFSSDPAGQLTIPADLK